MAGHVAPHRWADVAAGRLTSAQVAKLEAHAAKCPRCAEARDRVLVAREAFDDIREQETPRLHWDHIGARIYWVTSSERRAAGRKPGDRRFSPWMAFAGAGAVALVAVFVVGVTALGWFESSGSEAPVADRAPAEEGPPAMAKEDHATDVAVADEPAAQLRGVVTFAQGDVSVNGAPLSFDEPIGAGLRLTTGGGSVAVQFGAGSGFSLAADTKLFLRSFDERRIELVVEGAVSLDVARRPADQHLSVIAGERTVTVRGTAFRVENREGELRVACSRGYVILADSAGQLDLLAGESVRLGVGDAVLDTSARRLRAEQIERLERVVSMPMLPAWTDADALFATSATLELAVPADRSVKVDGIERGSGSFLLRVMSGRHHVDSDGKTGEWVDLGAGAREAVRRSAETASSGASLRRKQVAAAIGKSARIRRCLRPLEKQGMLEGSFIVLEIGINRDGTLGYLNIVEKDMPPKVASCVRDRVDELTLPAGPQATVRYKLAY